MDLNRDVQQIIFENLALPEKYNYYLHCRKTRQLEELRFIGKYFESLRSLSKQEWTEILIENENLPEEILVEYKEIVDWYIVCLYQKISESFMDKWATYINWGPISLHRKLSDEFIIRHQNELNWSYLSNSGNLSENIVNIFPKKVDWNLLVVDKYSIDFLKHYQDKINWHEVQFKNIEIYEIFKSHINWERLSYHNELTESFIRRFQDRLSWDFISSHQKLSKEFINEFSDKLNMDSVNRFIGRSLTTPPALMELSLAPPPLVRQRRYSRLRRRRQNISIRRRTRPIFFGN